MIRTTYDRLLRSKGQTLGGGGKLWRRAACVCFHRDANVQWTISVYTSLFHHQMVATPKHSKNKK